MDVKTEAKYALIANLISGNDLPEAEEIVKYVDTLIEYIFEQPAKNVSPLKLVLSDEKVSMNDIDFDPDADHWVHPSDIDD